MKLSDAFKSVKVPNSLSAIACRSDLRSWQRRRQLLLQQREALERWEAGVKRELRRIEARLGECDESIEGLKECSGQCCFQKREGKNHAATEIP